MMLRRSRPLRRPNQPFGFEALESRRLLAVSFGIYPINPTQLPGSIAASSDGNLWFTVSHSGSGGQTQIAEIGELDPGTGGVAYYPTPTPTSSLRSIISGPGGKLWFLDQSGTSNIASIDPTSHAIVEYLPTITGANIAGLAVGPDGNLWYTNSGTHSIGVFSPMAHTFSEFPLPNINDTPGAIADGPDGHLWFGTSIVGGHAIGDIDPTTHVITLTDLHSLVAFVGAITSGTDGNVWFNLLTPKSGGGFSSIGASIDPATHGVTTYSIIGTGGLTTGPDSNIWFGGSLGEFDLTTHVSTFYPEPGTYLPGTPEAITSGPEDSVWIVGSQTGYIISARIIPPTQAAVAGYVYLNPTGGVASSPLIGQTVYLDLKGDGMLDPGDPTINTGAIGYYSFTGLAPGTYTVRIAPYPGNIATSPASGGQTVTVSGGQLGSPGSLGMIPSISYFPLPYNPSPFGVHNPDVQTAEVTGLYNLVLGHAPDPAGLAYWVQNLKNGVPISVLSNYLLTSPEYDTNLILADYRNYLDVPSPTVTAVNEWVGFMQAGMTAKQVAYYFMTSDVFDNLYPSNTAFVQALYVDILGYQPASWEVSSWLTVLGEGVTRSQAVASFLNSSFADARVVTGQYGTILARQVDSYSLTAYVDLLAVGWTPVQVATTLFSTQEFAVRANNTVG